LLNDFILWLRERSIYIPAEMNSNADWIKCVKTLRGNHLLNKSANVIKLVRFTKK